MPIIEIRSVPPKSPSKIPTMLREASVAGARAFGIPPHKVWTLFEEVPSEYYAEGETLAADRRGDTHPPLVTVRALAGRTLEMKQAFLSAMCEAIGRGLDVPATSVWVHFVEMQKSEVWSNGAFYG